MTVQRINLLLVEDNQGDADLLREFLSEVALHIRLSHVQRLDDALRMLTLVSFDVVLLDLSLPDAQGFTAIHRIRRSTPHLPIVVLTGFSDEQFAMQAVQNGAQDYLVKGHVDGAIVAHALQYAIERARIVEALNDAQHFLQSTLDALPIHIAILDKNGTVMAVNLAWRQFAEANGYCGADHGVGTNYLNICDVAAVAGVGDAAAVGRGIRAVIDKEQDVFRYEYQCHSPTEQRWFLLHVTRFEGVESVRMVVIHENITELKQAEARLQQLAFYDPLTHLPNRTLFLDRLHQAVGQIKRRMNYGFAVCLLDLDRFKVVNDSLGHLAGDQLLVEVARRLRDCVRDVDTVARLGGDEFVILLDAVDSWRKVHLIVERIQRQLAAPCIIAGHEVAIGASIGITLSTFGYDQLEEVLRDADTALYRAKGQGRGCFAFFDATMHAHNLARFRLETDLRHALQHQELRVYYQPIVSVATGRVIGVEALARWPHPVRGFVSPLEFISIAEDAGLIGLLGEWVLSVACAQGRTWHAAGYPELMVGVNLSARQFRDPTLSTRIGQILQDTGFNPAYLDIELTENSVMEHAEATMNTLHTLKTLGIQLSIDDFGTGYSSLGYLKRFPISTLKVDRSFVQESTGDPSAAAIISAMVALAHNLNLHVVAEGVETAAQLQLVQAQACDAIQGFLCSKAIPAEQMTALLQANAILLPQT